MHRIKIKFLLAVFSILVGSASFALAQSKMPNLVSQSPNNSSGSAAVIPLDPVAATAGFSDVQYTPEAEKRAQQQRQIERQKQLMTGGFKWVSWSQIDDSSMKFILAHDPKQNFITGDSKYRDFAVADIDHDNQPDVIVYDWSECVAAGCQYVIYFSNKLQKPASFTAHDVKPLKNGVSVDGTYYDF